MLPGISFMGGVLISYRSPLYKPDKKVKITYLAWNKNDVLNFLDSV